jgi:hypothetical protein
MLQGICVRWADPLVRGALWQRQSGHVLSRPPVPRQGAEPHHPGARSSTATAGGSSRAGGHAQQAAAATGGCCAAGSAAGPPPAPRRAGGCRQGTRTCAQAAGQLCADLQFVGGGVVVQCLLVGVDRPELHTLQAVAGTAGQPPGAGQGVCCAGPRKRPPRQRPPPGGGGGGGVGAGSGAAGVDCPLVTMRCAPAGRRRSCGRWRCHLRLRRRSL